MQSVRSDIYHVTECPIPSSSGNYHEGVDTLLNLMGSSGLKFYKSHKESELGGEEGLIGRSDVVLVKVNAQWKYRGCTNSDVVRGLVHRILEHPDGFEGEVVLFENGQGGGSLKCATTWGGRYPDEGIHANAEDEGHSFSYLVDEVFADQRVSEYLLDPVRGTFIAGDDHTTDGYRRLLPVSYPCFTTDSGNRVELKEGIWNGKGYDTNLKLITVPVLKHHHGCGITGALKVFYGVLSMMDGGSAQRHYAKLGEHCGTMIAKVRSPTLSILDCTWVSAGSLAGYPSETTTRLNQLVASFDPVALDYWSSKHLLYPVDHNDEHNPDKFDVLSSHLSQAVDVINCNGGINGHMVTMKESEMNIYSTSACQ